MSLLRLGRTKNIKDSDSVDYDPILKARHVIAQLKKEIPLKKAILFGSALTSKFDANSDLDFLLVVEDKEDLRKMQKILYSRRWSDISIDFILKSESDFNSRKEIGGVCFEAFHYGLEL